MAGVMQMASHGKDEAESSVEGSSSQPELQEDGGGAAGEEGRGPSPAGSDPDAVATRRVFVNLGLLALMGALVSAWILFYTDWFPLVSGVLGLGGLFAWAAFLGGLLSDDRKASLQAAFERSVLTSRFTAAIVPALFGLFVLWVSVHGSLILDGKDGRGRLVAVVPKGESLQAQNDRDYLAPHAVKKRVVFTGWLGQSYAVQASGLPSALVTVGPLQPKRVAVPMQFAERAVLLAYLEPNLGIQAERAGASFVVTRGGRELKRIGPCDFHGGAVWVGCDAEVEIPEKVVDHWRLQLAHLFELSQEPGPNQDESQRQKAQRSEREWLNRWRDPAATGDLAFEALDDAQVAVTLPNGQQYGEGGRPRLNFNEGGRKIRLIYLEYANGDAKTKRRAFEDGAESLLTRPIKPLRSDTETQLECAV